MICDVIVATAAPRIFINAHKKKLLSRTNLCISQATIKKSHSVAMDNRD